MQYRYMTKDKLKVSQLGFGCMRFPLKQNDSKDIDEKEAIEMLHYAIDNGVNYIDTAYNYHQGNSEILVGKALKDGYREKVFLATKLPVWLTNSYEDFEKFLNEQLEKLQTDYIDFYLLHSLHEKTWNKISKLDIHKFLDMAKQKGKIKYVGFSFHDEFPLFKTIVDSYPWDFCQIQLNFMDKDYQAGIQGLKYAYEKGILVSIMEPIKGGKLASAPKEIQDVWNRYHIKRTPAEWALKWLYNLEEVSVVLSGMSTMNQVKENIKTASESLPNSLTNDEIQLIDEVTGIYKSKVKIGCTSCEYCLPCPSNIAIPSIFNIYNNMYVYGTEKESKATYNRLIEQGKDASKCVECGACESNCPQHLEIINTLKDADKALSY